jgi:mercuric ion binding protein
MKVIIPLKFKTLFMKLSILFFMITAFAITSCAQDQKKANRATTNEQTKTVATQKIKISVNGMVCSACQSTVKKTIKSLNGVKDVEVSLENKNAFITYYPNLINPEQIQKAINDKGYTAGKPQEVKQ